MTVDFVLDCVVAALAAVAAGWTIIARESFAAVVRFVTFGLLLTLAWVRLDAIDVAVTEGAIGSGLTGALLLGAALRLRTSEGSTAAEKPGVALRFAAALFSAAVATPSSSACSPRSSRARSRACAARAGPPVGWPVQYRVSGPDNDEVREIALQARPGRRRPMTARGGSISTGWNRPGRCASASTRTRRGFWA